MDKLNQPSDGNVSLNDGDSDDLNSIIPITSDEDTLKIVIHPSAFQRIGIDTTDPVSEDVIIEVDLGKKIIITPIFVPGNIPLYTISEEIFLIPIRLIIQVWT